MITKKKIRDQRKIRVAKKIGNGDKERRA